MCAVPLPHHTTTHLTRYTIPPSPHHWFARMEIKAMTTPIKLQNHDTGSAAAASTTTTCLPIDPTHTHTHTHTYQDLRVVLPEGVAAKDWCCATVYPKWEWGDPCFTMGIRGSRLNANTAPTQQQASATETVNRMETAILRCTTYSPHCPPQTGGFESWAASQSRRRERQCCQQSTSCFTSWKVYLMPAINTNADTSLWSPKYL